MKIKPLFDRVLLKNIERKNQTSSGLFIPETVGDEPLHATVVAVGPGDFFDGEKCEMAVSVGDTVIYNKYGATTIKLDNEEFIILRQSDILCIIKENNNGEDN